MESNDLFLSIEQVVGLKIGKGDRLSELKGFQLKKNLDTTEFPESILGRRKKSKKELPSEKYM